jgi:hypothetical protein
VCGRGPHTPYIADGTGEVTHWQKFFSSNASPAFFEWLDVPMAVSATANYAQEMPGATLVPRHVTTFRGYVMGLGK